MLSADLVDELIPVSRYFSVLFSDSPVRDSGEREDADVNTKLVHGFQTEFRRPLQVSERCPPSERCVGCSLGLLEVRREKVVMNIDARHLDVRDVRKEERVVANCIVHSLAL